jgi:hypothetical protein
MIFRQCGWTLNGLCIRRFVLASLVSECLSLNISFATLGICFSCQYKGHGDNHAMAGTLKTQFGFDDVNVVLHYQGL